VVSGEAGHCNYEARPHPGWTIITLNAYEVGLLQDEALPGYQEAARLMREYNPNPVLDQTKGIDFFSNLKGVSAPPQLPSTSLPALLI
jgi:hypothetical protein